MIQKIYDEVLNGNPKYILRDSNGNVLEDDVDIALKTPVVQQGTPINKALIENIQGDLYTQDSFNTPTISNYTTILDLEKLSMASTSITAEFEDIAYANGVYVVVGGAGYIFSSTNGTSWTSRTSGTSKYLSSVIHDGSQFVASGGEGTPILTSTDGITWTNKGNATSTSSSLNNGKKMIYDGEKYIFISSNAIYYSTNLTSWNNIPTSNIGVSTTLWDIAYGNGKYVACGTSNAILTSDNGISWSNTSTLTGTFYSVDYCNGLFLLSAGGNIYSSTNGINWTLRSTGAAGGTIYGFAYHAPYYIAASSGAILYSTNAINWIPVRHNLDTSTKRVTSGDNKVVFCGTNGKIVYSTGTQKGNEIYMNLNLPLSSYAKNKNVKIEGIGVSSYNTFENAYINVNNLGNKKINGILEKSKKYDLVYNGSTFDIINRAPIYGTVTVAENTTVMIKTLGAKCALLDIDGTGQKRRIFYPDDTSFELISTNDTTKNLLVTFFTLNILQIRNVNLSSYTFRYVLLF